MSIRVEIIEAGDRREFLFDSTTMTTRNAVQKEAEAAYVTALIRGFGTKARELAGLGAETWAREARAEEKLSRG